MKKTRLSDIFNTDSVRNKKRILDRFEINKKEKILFLDAVEEIKNNGGGGSSEGGEEHIYVPFDQLSSTMMKSMVLACAITLKIERTDGSKGVVYYGMAAMTMDSATIKEQTIAVEIIPSVIMTTNEGNVTTSEYMSSIGMDTDFLPRITKEEFYNTNI